eukprot:jgi/Tetstr1/420897/TSEL_011960.t1
MQTSFTTCSAQHHVALLSVLQQLVSSRRASGVLVAWLTSTDDHRGRKAFEALRATFLPHGEDKRISTLPRFLHKRTLRSGDLLDYMSRLTLIRVELEELGTPASAAATVAAFAQGIGRRPEFAHQGMHILSGVI